jgi:hypothetical protein
MMVEETKTSKYRKRYQKLRDEQNEYRVYWKEICDYLLPRRGKYLMGNNNDDVQSLGSKKHQKIITGSAVQALKILAGGLQGGLTSPSRPWFTLALQDEAMAEYAPVREWLHNVQGVMLAIMSRSNFYGAIHYVYWELGAFGTAAMLIEEDLETVIRCRPFTIGEYVLALDSTYRPNTLLRQFSMTAGQMRQEFGKGNKKMEGLPDPVVTALEQNQPDQRFEVQHAIECNECVDKSKSDYRGKQYKSVYYPLSSQQDIVLRESGYGSIPFIAPRWEVNGTNTYGDSPSMDALGDVKMLQKMQEKKLMALDKMVNPTMNGHISLKAQGATMVSGGVNWIDPAAGQQGFTPAYLVNPNLAQFSAAVQEVVTQIRSHYYNDMFLSVLGQDKDMTAFEVAKRHEEKLMMLGPIIERQQSESLGPIIDRVFNVMEGLGMFAKGTQLEIPQEMQGMPLKVEYTSLLAQAQQMVVTAPIQQLVGFTAQVAQAKMVADQAGIKKLNWDENIDQYAQALGTPPKCVHSDDEVEQMMAEDAKQKQAMMMAQHAESTSKALKNVAETPMKDGSTTALDALLGAVGGNPK